MWPPVMSNTIEACKRSGAKVIFFDNVHMYGKVSGAVAFASVGGNLLDPSTRESTARAGREQGRHVAALKVASLWRTTQVGTKWIPFKSENDDD